MAVGEEELERFEHDAQCADAHGGSKRGWQYSVGSRQSEEAKDEEEQSCKDCKDWKIPEVAVPISPRSEPIWDPPHLAHVRRWREGADRDGEQEESCEETGDSRQ